MALTERVSHRLEGNLRKHGWKVAFELESRTGFAKEKCRTVSFHADRRYR